MLRRSLLTALTIGMPILLGLLMLEVVLRTEPSLIGIVLLERFPVRLRTEIAERLNLPTSEDYRVIGPAERFDKGPPLLVPKPDARYPWIADPIDVGEGALLYRQFDSRGFCNPPDALASGSTDILVIGGSVPSCAGVDNALIFTALLAADTGLRAYDMTVGGVGPYEYVEVLRRFGLALKPRIVIMAFSEANDLRDCRTYLSFVAGKSEKGRSASDSNLTRLHGMPHTFSVLSGKIPLRRGWAWPLSSSYALWFFWSGIQYAIDAIAANFDENFFYSAEIQGQRRPLNVANGNLDELDGAKMVGIGKLDLGLCEKPLRQFAELGRENDFIPVVMATPAAYMAYRKTVEFKDPANGPIMAAYDEAQRKWLADNAKDFGYVFVDPVAAMQQAALTAPLLYFPSNAHLTVAGHRLLADTVAPQIKALLSPASQ